MARNDYLQLTARLDINSQSRAFRDKSWKAAATTLRQVANRAAKFAKENVAEGKGPSPHPHRWPYEDTGDLANSIGIKFMYAGARMNAVVYTNLDYGTYLEVGWKSRGGGFFRYPWLKPAYQKAGQGFAKVASDNWKRAVSEIATGEQVMSSGDVDVYGLNETLKLLKPVNGWKQQEESGFSKEFLDILTQGNVEPPPPPVDVGRTKRNREAFGSLVDLANSLHKAGRGQRSARRIAAAPKRTYARSRKGQSTGTRIKSTRQSLLNSARADAQQAYADHQARKLSRVIKKAGQVRRRRKK